MQTIGETGAEHIIATHGYTAPLTRLLSERGLRASSTKTEWVGDEDEGTAATDDETSIFDAESPGEASS